MKLTLKQLKQRIEEAISKGVVYSNVDSTICVYEGAGERYIEEDEVPVMIVKVNTEG